MDVKQVSKSIPIHFRSRGGAYSAIFMAETGDLWQEYDGTANNVKKYYPDFTQNPVTLNLTVASSQGTGLVSFDNTPEYYVAGTKLTFSGLACTTVGFTDKFALTSTGMLKVIGNLVGIAGGHNFTIEAHVSVSGDSITAYLPVTIAQHTDSTILRVTIAAPDGKNFNITSKEVSSGTQPESSFCTLRALTFRNGETIIPYAYKWYKLDGTMWKDLNVSTQDLKVREPEVESYATYKVEVWETSQTANPVSDIQGVVDSSDPYMVEVTLKRSDNGGAAVDTSDTSFSDSSLDTDYLLITPHLYVRGDTSKEITGVTWTQGSLVTASGVTVQNINYSSGYKVTAEFVKSAPGEDFEFIFNGEI